MNDQQTPLNAPSLLKTAPEWAAVYGWPQVYAWKENLSRRAIAELMPLPGDEPAPEETPLERQFHEAMAAAYPPDPEDMAWLRKKLGLPPLEG